MMHLCAVTICFAALCISISQAQMIVDTVTATTTGMHLCACNFPWFFRTTTITTIYRTTRTIVPETTYLAPTTRMPIPVGVPATSTVSHASTSTVAYSSSYTSIDIHVDQDSTIALSFIESSSLSYSTDSLATPSPVSSGTSSSSGYMSSSTSDTTTYRIALSSSILGPSTSISALFTSNVTIYPIAIRSTSLTTITSFSGSSTTSEAEPPLQIASPLMSIVECTSSGPVVFQPGPSATTLARVFKRSPNEPHTTFGRERFTKYNLPYTSISLTSVQEAAELHATAVANVERRSVASDSGRMAAVQPTTTHTFRSKTQKARQAKDIGRRLSRESSRPLGPGIPVVWEGNWVSDLNTTAKGSNSVKSQLEK